MRFKMFTGKNSHKEFTQWLEDDELISEIISVTESGLYGITTISIFYKQTDNNK